MDLFLRDSLEEFDRTSTQSSATQFRKKPFSLRIVVPPTEYCPFSTDLILPSTPHPLPTPVSSSCFTFSNMQELMNQNVLVQPTSAPALSPCLCTTAVAADSASPTSSQFLLMPPASHLENVDSETPICISPLAMPGSASEPICTGSLGTKSENLRPCQVSSSTWLSDLGGHTHTDRIFQHNLLEATESSPPSTPALSPSALSPSSQVSTISAYNSPSSLARPPPSLLAALSAFPCTMSHRSSSPARLVLKPTGTDTFPSTLDSLQAWRERVTPGPPRSEEPCSPLSEDVHGVQLGESTQETPIYPSPSSHQPHTRLFSQRSTRASRAQTLIKHAKTIGGRVKRLVIRQSANKHRVTMDRGVNFRVVTSQDSENGSVILISAPPPPYDARQLTITSHGSTGQEHARSRTISEYSSAVQTSTVEHPDGAMTESGSRQGSSNRNPLRRLSFAALSTIKRF